MDEYNLTNYKFDTKDFEILRELDINFRQSFSKIGKKVKLSKNSVMLRFEKLKNFMLHNLTGINYGILGLREVKVYYSFDFFNDKTESNIIKEIKNYKNVIYAARYYGNYDLCICFLVENIDDLISQVWKFNEKFSSKITQKDMQIAWKHFYFRYNFLHEKSIYETKVVVKDKYRINLSDKEKKIIEVIRYNPRMSIINISNKTRLSPKTISNKIKELIDKKVIMGFFMALDTVKFNHNTFKILLQIKDLKESEEFEKYLCTIKNVKYIVKMSGLWDYEIDLIYPNISELQKQIEIIKEKYPNLLKKITILSFNKRIITNDFKF